MSLSAPGKRRSMRRFLWQDGEGLTTQQTPAYSGDVIFCPVFFMLSPLLATGCILFTASCRAAVRAPAVAMVKKSKKQILI